MKTIWFIVLWLLLNAGLLAVVMAHDPEHPELDRWYLNLKNKNKSPCCDMSDSHAVQPDDWKSENGHYVVMLDGKWKVVPEFAVIDQPNLAQHALVWFSPAWSSEGRQILCFMPGPGM
jgi:hypothetical protein